jgi:hypothetical protein
MRKALMIVAVAAIALVAQQVISQNHKSDTPTSAPAQFANIKCPIMTGNAIDPAKVTPALTREFNGQKVAFCCGGCPGQWDKLSDKEKQAKLDAVKAPAPTTKPAEKSGSGGCCG